MGKLLVVIGIALVAVGLLVILGVPFGRLPGDLVFRRGSFTLYVPLATSIALSLILTLLVMMLRR
jgi:hypothetical protein